MNKKCNEALLDYNWNATIKEFVENNSIKCNYDIFSEYININPYDDDDNNESE